MIDVQVAVAVVVEERDAAGGDLRDAVPAVGPFGPRRIRGDQRGQADEALCVYGLVLQGIFLGIIHEMPG